MTYVMMPIALKFAHIFPEVRIGVGELPHFVSANLGRCFPHYEEGRSLDEELELMRGDLLLMTDEGKKAHLLAQLLGVVSLGKGEVV
jgi:hypothetical protein